jgi:hypothetical protein
MSGRPGSLMVLDCNLRCGTKRRGFLLPKVWARVYGIRKSLREFLNLWTVRLYIRFNTNSGYGNDQE